MANKRVRPRKKKQKFENFQAFTQKYNELSNRIITAVGLSPAFNPADHQKELPYPITEFNALWDTGATRSVLTASTVKELNLISVGTTVVNHAGGSSPSNTYAVNFFLPNRVLVSGVLVSECDDLAGNFGAIIGMDIITSGDLAITNANGKTWVSFRVPSINGIDYVEEHNSQRPKK